MRCVMSLAPLTWAHACVYGVLGLEKPFLAHGASLFWHAD